MEAKMEKLDLKKTIFYFIKKSWIIAIITFLTLTFGYFYESSKNSVNISVCNAKLYINSPSTSSFLACLDLGKSDKLLNDIETAFNSSSLETGYESVKSYYNKIKDLTKSTVPEGYQRKSYSPNRVAHLPPNISVLIFTSLIYLDKFQ